MIGAAKAGGIVFAYDDYLPFRSKVRSAGNPLNPGPNVVEDDSETIIDADCLLLIIEITLQLLVGSKSA